MPCVSMNKHTNRPSRLLKTLTSCFLISHWQVNKMLIALKNTKQLLIKTTRVIDVIVSASNIERYCSTGVRSLSQVQYIQHQSLYQNCNLFWQTTSWGTFITTHIPAHLTDLYFLHMCNWRIGLRPYQPYSVVDLKHGILQVHRITDFSRVSIASVVW